MDKIQLNNLSPKGQEIIERIIAVWKKISIDEKREIEACHIRMYVHSDNAVTFLFNLGGKEPDGFQISGDSIDFTSEFQEENFLDFLKKDINGIQFKGIINGHVEE